MIFALWRKWQRLFDRQIMWREIKAQTGDDVRAARIAMRVHMEMDPAYSDFTNTEKEDYLRQLK